MECNDCKNRMYMSAMSFTKCEECGVDTIAGTRPGYKICLACALDNTECRRCRKNMEDE